MAADGWRSTRPLSEQLRRDFAEFDYYQLIRLLLGPAEGDGLREALDRRLRFRADLSTAFPGREISRLEEGTRRDGSGLLTLHTPNYCIAGTLGPLPEPYVEWLRARMRLRDRAMGDFLDLFNHRINVLRYLVKVRLAPGLEGRRPEESDLGRYLAAAIGLGEPGLAAQAPLPMRALLGVAGLLVDRRPSLPRVRQVLRLYLRAPVEVVPLQGGWRPLDEQDRTLLGRRNHRLGDGALLGGRAWDPAAAIRIEIGPLSWRAFRRLLPGGEGHRPLAELLRLLTDRRFDCRVRLELTRDALPRSLLQTRPAPLQGLALNRTAWLNRSALGSGGLGGTAAGTQGRRHRSTVKERIGTALGRDAWLHARAPEGKRAEFTIPAWPARPDHPAEEAA